MALSRKNYVSIAAIFRAHSRRALGGAGGHVANGETGAADVWLSLRDDITDYLANDNPNFDRERFKRATEPDGKADPESPGEPTALQGVRVFDNDGKTADRGD